MGQGAPCVGDMPLLTEGDDWVAKDGRIHFLLHTTVPDELNAADLAAMTEALNNER
jgi:hypothetical protein